MQDLLAWKHEGELRQIERRRKGDRVGRRIYRDLARLVLFGRAAPRFAGLLAGARSRQGAGLRKSEA